jgi:hypothetical protein
MPKKGKGKPRPAYQLRNKAMFQVFIEAGKPKPAPLEKKKLCGFPLKNVNQLWRWDTMEDVNI